MGKSRHAALPSREKRSPFWLYGQLVLWQRKVSDAPMSESCTHSGHILVVKASELQMSVTGGSAGLSASRYLT